MLRQNLKTIRGWLEEEGSQASKYVLHCRALSCWIKYASRLLLKNWLVCRSGSEEVKKLSEHSKPQQPKEK